jgi:plasmid stabilization system protein ParE
MFEVIWLPIALKDLERHFDFLNDKNPEAASRASRALLNAGASLSQSPERCRMISGSNQRKLRVFFGKHGYFLYYRIEDEKVFILRVHHGRENRSD